MAKAKPPKEPTSFGSSSADGGHAAASPGLASAHKKPKKTNAEQSAVEGNEDDSSKALRKLAKPK